MSRDSAECFSCSSLRPDRNGRLLGIRPALYLLIALADVSRCAVYSDSSVVRDASQSTEPQRTRSIRPCK